jgi:putative oxygen-independent coproporphyrinogen III oxidase
MSDLSFYVHIPYCVKRCGYCDFNTYTPAELREGGTLEGVSGDYINAVIREIDIAYHRNPNASVPTIFFGGGTPSLLPPRDLGRVISSIRERWSLNSDAEITLEANPDSVDAGKLHELRSVGFNRISFGMQSAVPHVLKVLDRTHNPDNISKVVEAARGAGFESISLDLIYGTPGESIEDFRTSVMSALELGVEHLSAYALIVESGTKLAAQIKRGDLTMPNDDLMVKSTSPGTAQHRILAQCQLVGSGSGRPLPHRWYALVECEASDGVQESSLWWRIAHARK